MLKIINSTGNPVAYLVVPSGGGLTEAVASGSIGANNAVEFKVDDPTLKVPDVLVRSTTPKDEYYFRQTLAGVNSTARISITEE